MRALLCAALVWFDTVTDWAAVSDRLALAATTVVCLCGGLALAGFVLLLGASWEWALVAGLAGFASAVDVALSV